MLVGFTSASLSWPAGKRAGYILYMTAPAGVRCFSLRSARGRLHKGEKNEARISYSVRNDPQAEAGSQ